LSQQHSDFTNHSDTSHSDWSNHSDTAHRDWADHSDVAHSDTTGHYDVWHEDSYPHNDVGFGNFANHYDTPHSDGIAWHGDSAHSNFTQHADIAPQPPWTNHSDAPHDDTVIHSDTPHDDTTYHTDQAHGDFSNHYDAGHNDVVHSDTPHTNWSNHGDTTHADWGDHKDAAHGDAPIHDDVPFTDVVQPLYVNVKVDKSQCISPCDITITVEFGGGTPPYKLDIDYGDGTSYSNTYNSPQTLQFKKTYTLPTGITSSTYRITATVTDSTGKSASGYQDVVVTITKWTGYFKLEVDYSPKEFTWDCTTGTCSPETFTINYKVSWDAGNLEQAFPEFSSFAYVLVIARTSTGEYFVVYRSDQRSGSYSGSITSPGVWGPQNFSTITEISGCIVAEYKPEFAQISKAACVPGTNIFYATTLTRILKNAKVYVAWQDISWLNNAKVTVKLGTETKTYKYAPADFAVPLIKAGDSLPLTVTWTWDDTDLGGGEIIPAGSRTFSTNIKITECDTRITAVPDQPFPEYKPYFDIKVSCLTKVYTGQNVALRISVLGGKSPYTCKVKAVGPTFNSMEEVILDKTETSSAGIFAYDFDFGLPSANITSAKGTIYVSVTDADGRVREKTIEVEIYPAVEGVTPGIPPPPPPPERKRRLAAKLMVEPLPPWEPTQKIKVTTYVTCDDQPFDKVAVYWYLVWDGRKQYEFGPAYPKNGYATAEFLMPLATSGKSITLCTLAFPTEEATYLYGEEVETCIPGDVSLWKAGQTRIVLNMFTAVNVGSINDILGVVEGLGPDYTWKRVSGGKVSIYINDKYVGDAPIGSLGEFRYPYTWETAGKYVVKVVYPGQPGVWEGCSASITVLVTETPLETGYPENPENVEQPPPGATPPTSAGTPTYGVVNIDLAVEPSPPWNIGQSLRLTATVWKDSTPLKNRLVYFYASAGGYTKMLYGKYTDVNGRATIDYTVPSSLDGVSLKDKTLTFFAVDVESGSISNMVGGLVKAPSAWVVAGIAGALAALGGLTAWFLSKGRKR